MTHKRNLFQIFLVLFVCIAFSHCSLNKSQPLNNPPLNIGEYLQLADSGGIYPNSQQLEMLKSQIPKEAFQPAPPVGDRKYWDKIASSQSGKEYLEEALSLLEKEPEIPISDEIYKRANKEGNRGIYKPRYYRTMDRLEKFILAECIENQGRFLPQVEVYSKAIMEMKSWLHPNHDDDENSVLEGKRVAIDLGARKFGLVLALSDALLEDKLSADLRDEIADQLRWRIIDSYLKSCRGEDNKGNRWIRTTSNWNSVCTSGTIFTTIVASEHLDERLVAIGCALNSMKYYVSGFGSDGYCSEGTGYWSYGFGHYLYLAEILFNYTDGRINLFDFNDSEKLKKVANFPENFQIHSELYAAFSDGVTRVRIGSDNFAYVMAAKHYGAQKPLKFIPEESVQTLVVWSDSVDYTSRDSNQNPLPEVTYFDDYGIVISRGQQQVPFSIAVKAGHNAENHNHSDVGTYVIALGDNILTGDIGAPSYIAGAFAKDNPARSSWGHPVPRIDNTLQSNGIEFAGDILSTEFTKSKDKIVMDIQGAYEIPSLKSLVRTMENDKSGEGTITIIDQFSSTKPVTFGVSIMTLSEYEIVDGKTIILTENGQKIKAEVSGNGAEIKIIDELVPVKHLREGGPAYRIGVDFTEPIKEGVITIKYRPIF